MEYVFSDYFRYRLELRGFDLKKIEDILHYSQERYFDTETHRQIVIGKHDNILVMIPYDQTADKIIPVTIHATTRQQLKFRLNTGRAIHD